MHYIGLAIGALFVGGIFVWFLWWVGSLVVALFWGSRELVKAVDWRHPLRVTCSACNEVLYRRGWGHNKQYYCPNGHKISTVSRDPLERLGGWAP